MSLPLTQSRQSATLPDNKPSAPRREIVSESFQAVAEDPGVLFGRLTAMNSKLRRGLIAMVQAIEEFEGIEPKVCKHCGRPVR